MINFPYGIITNRKKERRWQRQTEALFFKVLGRAFHPRSRTGRLVLDIFYKEELC